ncbi:thiolase family protein [Bradyrhizobium sp. USDA 10063]
MAQYYQWSGCTQDEAVTARSSWLHAHFADCQVCLEEIRHQPQGSGSIRPAVPTAHRDSSKAERLGAEIAPLATTMALVDKATGQTSYKEVTLTRDEGNRPDTTLETLQGLKPVVEGGVITAGNVNQLSDRASACVEMERSLAEKRSIEPLGIYRGIAVAGCAPEEMGIGPIYAIPKRLKHHGLKIGCQSALEWDPYQHAKGL